eukprot:3824964-Rhodomonas_salina.8
MYRVQFGASTHASGAADASMEYNGKPVLMPPALCTWHQPKHNGECKYSVTWQRRLSPAISSAE